LIFIIHSTSSDSLLDGTKESLASWVLEYKKIQGVVINSHTNNRHYSAITTCTNLPQRTATAQSSAIADSHLDDCGLQAAACMLLNTNTRAQRVRVSPQARARN